jgi:hypothetical protein
MRPSFDPPAGTIPRDRWNRPLVTPPDGGKAVAYTRCTTFVDCLEDKYNLQQWQLRQCAIGLADRADLLMAVSAHRDDKKALNGITDKAMEAAASSAASTTGTAVHALCERVDRGQPLGIVPPQARRDVEAYQAATSFLEHIHIEQFTVCDDLKIGGTPDRVVRWGDEYYIADIKTGSSVTWGALKIAMQLAVYAHSIPYIPPGVRREYDGYVNLDKAIVIHLPAGEAKPQLYFVDIKAGWDAVQTASDVRTWRARKDWYEPIYVPELPPPAAVAAVSTVDELITSAATVDELRHVWAKAIAAGTWTEANLAHAVERKAELERVAS